MSCHVKVYLVSYFSGSINSLHSSALLCIIVYPIKHAQELVCEHHAPIEVSWRLFQHNP